MITPHDRASNAFLRHVYLHGRLWTLSFALQSSFSTSGGNSDGQAVSKPLAEDCFEAAVRCCEAVVCDIQTIGEPLYCMPAPVWSMMSYAAIVALDLFRWLYGMKMGQDVELLGLVAQVALQLQKAGTTPSHRAGIAALLGQHLFVMLRLRAADLKDSSLIPEDFNPLDSDAVFESDCQTPFGFTKATYDVVDDTHRILMQPPIIDLPSQPFITPFVFPNEMFTSADVASLMGAGLYGGFDLVQFDIFQTTMPVFRLL